MRRKIIPYNPKLKELARELRKKSTLAEVLLWNQLKGRQMMGYDFHRQKPIDNYIVDFYCPELMFAIEIDGISHMDKTEYDIKRERILKSLGVSMLRFTEMQVRKKMFYVLTAIEGWINENTL